MFPCFKIFLRTAAGTNGARPVRPTAGDGGGGELETANPILDLLLRFILGHAVAFLDAADELVLLPVDHLQVIIGEFAPLFFDLAGKLLPVDLYHVPIHWHAPYS